MGGSSGNSLTDIGSGVSIFFIGRIVQNGLGFLFHFVVTRSLGASGYGLYTLANTIIQTVSRLSNLGTDKGILKFVPAAEDKNGLDQDEVMALAGIATSIGSLLVTTTILFTSSGITNLLSEPDYFSTALQLFAICLPFISLQVVINSYFRSKNNLRYKIIVTDFFQPLAKLTLTVIILYMGFELYGVVLGTLIAWVLSLLIAISILRSQIETFSSINIILNNKIQKSKEFFVFSLPLIAADAGTLLYKRMDIYMIGFYLTSTDVGIYGAAVVITQFLSLPISGINQLFPSIASGLYERGNIAELDQLFKDVTRWATMLAAFPVVIIITHSNTILSLFGPEFTAGTLVLSILCVGKLVDNLVGPSGFLLMMTNHERLASLNQWSFGVINVGLNYILIDRIGVVGAALATAAVLTLLNLTRVLEIYYLESLSPYSGRLASVFFAAVISLIVAFFIGSQLDSIGSLLLSVIIGGTIYTFIIYHVGISDRDTEMIIRMID